jgi:acetoin utilization deacetylase AcuC-like enzyme
VAILDMDYHHGNGQQDIFYRRKDVLTVSIHGHPRFAYPYFTGFEDERGDGEGEGFNLNIPCPRRSTARNTARPWRAPCSGSENSSPSSWFWVLAWTRPRGTPPARGP